MCQPAYVELHKLFQANPSVVHAFPSPKKWLGPGHPTEIEDFLQCPLNQVTLPSGAVAQIRSGAHEKERETKGLAFRFFLKTS